MYTVYFLMCIISIHYIAIHDHQFGVISPGFGGKHVTTSDTYRYLDGPRASLRFDLFSAIAVWFRKVRKIIMSDFEELKWSDEITKYWTWLIYRIYFWYIYTVCIDSVDSYTTLPRVVIVKNKWCHFRPWISMVLDLVEG